MKVLGVNFFLKHSVVVVVVVVVELVFAANQELELRNRIDCCLDHAHPFISRNYQTLITVN